MEQIFINYLKPKQQKNFRRLSNINAVYRDDKNLLWYHLDNCKNLYLLYTLLDLEW